MTAMVLLLILLFLLGIASVLGWTADSRDSEHSVGALVAWGARHRRRP